MTPKPQAPAETKPEPKPASPAKKKAPASKPATNPFAERHPINQARASSRREKGARNGRYTP